MDVMVIPVVAMSIPIVVAPFAIVCAFQRKVREMEHRERMLALELGRSLPGDGTWWSPARLSMAFGVVVPIASLGIGWIATESLHGTRAEPLQIMCGMVGLVSLIVGGRLASRSVSLQQQDRAADRLASMATAKPSFDPDAFDVVGTRGR